MFPPRYTGTRWAIVYGSYSGIEQTALDTLQRSVQQYFPYVIAIHPSNAPLPEEDTNIILLGTPQSNPMIAELLARGLLSAPTAPEGYSLCCADSPWHEGTRMLIIAGADAKGVLNGVHDLDARVLSVEVTPLSPTKTARETFDTMTDFTINEAPAVQNRGIWTWGYVIYDYRGFLENMARLKMNTLVVWNDIPPVNIVQILEYAHSRGIKIIMGFPWGWGDFELPQLLEPETRSKIKADILKHYQEYYRHLDIDGIYFQTCTEHYEKFLDGRSTAAITCEWVNEVAHEFYAIQPDLDIVFGLHATSISERYVDYGDLDPRVTIMWEDAGTLPYTYGPEITRPGNFERNTFSDTLAYSKQLVNFRAANTHFAIVPKGWMCLRWDTEFEHHGPFILGERSQEFIKARLAERQPNWDRHNNLWLSLYPYAAQFYREILAEHPSQMTVTGLVEDAMFEARIQPSVAIFAETLWNPLQSDAEILRQALSPYYQRT